MPLEKRPHRLGSMPKGRARKHGGQLTELLPFSGVTRERIVNLLPGREHGALEGDRRLLLLQLAQLHHTLAATAIEQG